MNSNSEINPTISYIKAKMKRGKIVSADDAVRVIQISECILLQV